MGWRGESRSKEQKTRSERSASMRESARSRVRTAVIQVFREQLARGKVFEVLVWV